jgi:Kef-type K+ transport system membrane component KefB
VLKPPVVDVGQLAPSPEAFSDELQYVLLLFVLFVLPRALQRYRLPSAITCVVLGAIASIGFNLFAHDSVVTLLSTFGIVSLFLFAGLDVEFQELQRNARILTQHILIRVMLVAAVTLAAVQFLGLGIQASILTALALTTPSTGFILDSLNSLGVSSSEKTWIKAKAIATELVALAVLFLALQPPRPVSILKSTAIMVGLIAFLPVIFRLFARIVLPYAPKSEFAFLLMLAVLSALVTRELGAYYLVGAFIVGLTAQRFRERMPAIASTQMIGAVELFASFFVPFYFFHAGLGLRSGDFSRNSLLLGALFVAVMIPLRISLVAVHRRYSLGESLRKGARIGLSISPTLVFTLVIAEILRDRFGVSQAVFGGLIIYTLANTLLPGFILRLAPAPETEVELPLPEMALAVPHTSPADAPHWAVESPGEGDAGR